MTNRDSRRSPLNLGDETIYTGIAPEDMQRIRRALGNLPYGGLALAVGNVEDVDSLIGWLTSFAGILRQHAERVEAAEAERLELMRQRDAVRRFLGLDEILGRLDEVAPED